MLSALIFDFDGLLIDTETPALQSWQAIYADYGYTLGLERWQTALGSNQGFDPLEHLILLLSQQRDPISLDTDLLDQLRVRREVLKHELSMRQPLLPGVLDILAAAHAHGLLCAVASSSPRAWVDGWLTHHRIRAWFACVSTADDVAHTKPAPDLFLSAAAWLGVEPADCLVFEDSPNGILAAQAAGMRCVAVPGAISRQLPMPPATLVLPSLAALPLAEIMRQAGETRNEEG